jgi:hypothetical protein
MLLLKELYQLSEYGFRRLLHKGRTRLASRCAAMKWSHRVKCSASIINVILCLKKVMHHGKE